MVRIADNAQSLLAFGALFIKDPNSPHGKIAAFHAVQGELEARGHAVGGVLPENDNWIDIPVPQPSQKDGEIMGVLLPVGGNKELVDPGQNEGLNAA